MENHNQHFKKPHAALLYTYQSQNAFFAVKGLPPVLYSLNSLQKCKHDPIKIGEYSEKEKIKIKVANQMYFIIYFQMSSTNSPEKSKHRSLYLTVSTPSCALFLWKTLLKEKLRKLQASQCRSIRPYFDINGSKKRDFLHKQLFITLLHA